MPTPLLRRAGLAATLALLATAPAAAQTTPATDQPGRSGRGAELFKELNLTTDQQAKVDAIMRDNRPASRPSGPPTEADRQAMQARRAELDAQLKAVLTPEQYAKYQSLRPQRGPRPAAN